MQRMKYKGIVAFLALGVAAALLAGCQVDTHKSGDGEDVKVATPFGGLRVKTDSADVLSSIGLPAYPGAQLVKKGKAFYRDGMKHFGDVIECRDGQAVGTPARTAEGLTCDNKHGGHIDVDDHPIRNKIELKAGSEQHQHLVEIDPEDGGTKFGLVALDLPGKFFSDRGDNSDKQ